MAVLHHLHVECGHADLGEGLCIGRLDTARIVVGHRVHGHGADRLRRVEHHLRPIGLGLRTRFPTATSTPALACPIPVIERVRRETRARVRRCARDAALCIGRPVDDDRIGGESLGEKAARDRKQTNQSHRLGGDSAQHTHYPPLCGSLRTRDASCDHHVRPEHDRFHEVTFVE